MNTMRISHIVLSLLLLTSITAAGQGSLDWEEKAEFGVEIAGKIDITAQVFQPTNYQPFLILTSERLKSPVLIDLAKKKVYSLKTSDIKAEGDFLHTNGIPNGKSVAKYAMKGGASTFKVHGTKVSMTIRQTLVGEIEPAIILAHSPDYTIRMEKYKPNRKSINTIKACKNQTEVVVMFATWCSTCKVVLPQVMRIFDDAANSRLNIRYIGIAQGGDEPRDALERYGHDYPAVILLRDGKEIDRILGPTPYPIENAIAKTLR